MAEIGERSKWKNKGKQFKWMDEARAAFTFQSDVGSVQSFFVTPVNRIVLFTKPLMKLKRARRTFALGIKWKRSDKKIPKHCDHLPDARTFSIAFHVECG